MGAGLGKDSLMPLMGSNHCAMIGLDSAGKTTVLYRLKFNQYVNTAPTIGFNCEKFRLNGSNFTVWDVGGQDKLRPLWKSYTRCTDGIIFVVDSSKEDRLEEAKLELLRFCKTTATHGSKGSSSSSHTPVLVLANKQDLPSAMDTLKLEQLLGLKELGPNVPVHLQPCCAITGEGLAEGLKALTELILLKKKAKGLNGSTGMSRSTSGKKLQRSHSTVY